MIKTHDSMPLCVLIAAHRANKATTPSYHHLLPQRGYHLISSSVDSKPESQTAALAEAGRCGCRCRWP